MSRCVYSNRICQVYIGDIKVKKCEETYEVNNCQNEPKRLEQWKMVDSRWPIFKWGWKRSSVKESWFLQFRKLSKAEGGIMMVKNHGTTLFENMKKQNFSNEKQDQCDVCWTIYLMLVSHSSLLLPFTFKGQVDGSYWYANNHFCWEGNWWRSSKVDNGDGSENRDLCVGAFAATDCQRSERVSHGRTVPGANICAFERICPLIARRPWSHCVGSIYEKTCDRGVSFVLATDADYR